jgi:lipoprotein-anchoring transpeptidase ErfK/SrfK
MSTHPHPPGSNAIRLRERELRDTPKPHQPRQPRSRLPIVAALLTLALLFVAAIGAYLYDHGRRDLIAPGVRVGGVNIGGLRVDAARERLRTALVGRLERQPVTVHAGGRTFSLSAHDAHLSVAVDTLTSEALTRSRQGSIFTRVINGLDGHAVNVDLPDRVNYSHVAVRGLLKQIADATNRPAREASVVPGAGGLQTAQSHDGVAVNTVLLGSQIDRSLVSPTGPRNVIAPLNVVHPATSTASLASKYPAYIVIDRANFRLRFYQHLQLANTYTIAVGRQGLETPAGLYDIQWKEVNPSWHVPNSSWAGALAGQTIPPGPQDPIKARWMAFNGGAGIHGTDVTSSLGTAASHGCIRMAIPDVIALYPRVPVGTPVYVA